MVASCLLGGGAVGARSQLSLDSKSTARGFNAIGDELVESVSVASVKDASLALLER